MKRLVLTCMCVLYALSASAQYAVSPSELNTKGARVFLDGVKLDKTSAAACFSDMNGLDRSGDYLKYRGAYKAGLGLTIGGASLAVVGSMTAIVGVTAVVIAAVPSGISGKDVPKELVATYVTGICAGFIGLAAVASGIPTLCVYKSRIKKMAGEYNTFNSPKSEVSFGGQSSGIGFSLKF